MATGGDGQRPDEDPALLRRHFDANPDGLRLLGAAGFPRVTSKEG